MKTRTALIQLLKENRDYRTFFKGCCNASALRLRSQAWRFRDELLVLGVAASLESVQDALLELARDLFPDSPGADFTTWAGLLCGDAMARLSEHYANLSPEEKDAIDLSAAWQRNDAIVAACEVESLAALRKALRSYEREARQAVEATRERSGAA